MMTKHEFALKTVFVFLLHLNRRMTYVSYNYRIQPIEMVQRLQNDLNLLRFTCCNALSFMSYSFCALKNALGFE